MTVLQLDIYPADDPLGTPLVTLTDEDVATFEMRVAENSLGAGSFKIRRDHPDATEANLAADNYVTVTIPAIDDDPVFGFWLEHHEDAILAKNEEGAETLTRQGPGALAIIGRAAFLDEHYAAAPPASDDRGSGNEIPGYWRWQHKQYGQIFVRLIEEGQTQPGAPLADVTLDFDRDVDSDGVDWPAIDRDVRFEIGTDGLTFMDRFAETGEVFITCDPDLEVHARQARGVDRHSGSFGAGKVRLVKGVNIQTELVRIGDTSLAATHAIVEGMENSYVQVVSPSYSPGDPGKWLRVPYDSSNDEDVLEKVGLEALARGVAELNEITMEIFAGDDEANGLYLPFKHFNVSDLVTVHTGTEPTDYNEQTERVRAFTIALRAASSDTATDTLTADEMAQRSLVVGVECGGVAGSFGVDVDVTVEEKGCGGCPEPPPVSPGDVEAECAGSAYDMTAAGIYSAPGSYAGTTDKVIYYTRPGLSFPIVPTYPFSGGLNFGQLGPPDFAGDCVSNTIRLMFVGSGTAVVQSAAYVSGTRPIMLTHKSQTSGDIEVQYGTSGDAFTFAIDNSDGDCVHWIDFFDGIGAPCGGKWGFSSVTWNRATEYDGTVPVSGQEVRQEFTGDGTTTSYDTVGTPPLAYRAGSLRVWVGGLDWTPSVTETDPDTGAWDLDYAPPDGATIKVWFVYP